MSPRVIVLALDGVPPELLFDETISSRLPTITRLRRAGHFGPLRSTIPPITVPAWASAVTGQGPGQLGLYGIRDRIPGTYAQFRAASSDAIRGSAIWDQAGRAGMRSTVIGVPPGYPPARIEGSWVGCMLTPSTSAAYTWPPELKDEIARVVGDYVFDVEGFRRRERSELVQAIREMTARRWRLARHLLATKESDLFVLHEIGPDRMHHGFWKDHDSAHPRHDPASRFRSAVLDYYRQLDGEIARLLELAPDAHVVVLSDHGCRPMLGGIRVNQWLLDNGYLRLKGGVPKEPVPFADELVDWSGTSAWGAGGYHARVWLNIRGRDPSGIVGPSSAGRLRDEIAEGLEAIPSPEGGPLGTRVHIPEHVYRELKGAPPDLMVYFGDLAWRSVATVGGMGWHTEANDTGPDDANHSEHGVIVLAVHDRMVSLEGASLVDVHRTLASLLAIEPGERSGGRSLVA